MKILQLCTKIPFPPKDGGAAGIYVFTRAFEAAGHIVDVLAVNPPKHLIHKQEYDHLPQNIRIHSIFIDTSPRLFPALRNILFSRKSYHVERFFHPDFASRLIALIQEVSPDIIQVEGIYLGDYLPLIRKYSKSKIVLREHNIEHLLWKEIASQEKNILKKFYLNIQVNRMRLFEYKQIKKADAVTFVTNEDMQVIMQNCPDVKTLVIPFGVTVHDRPEITRIDTDSIYFLGALDWIPNQEAILWFVTTVWPKLREKFPQMVFHIAGRNAPPALASGLSNVVGIQYHGEVPDAASFTAPFSITISPLFTGSGVRVKIIEAMEQGKVVIASAKAVIGIPVVPGEHLLIADNADDYIMQLEMLRLSPERTTEIGQNARQFIKDQYDIKTIASRLTELYNEL